jgi:hypothetical protein
MNESGSKVKILWERGPEDEVQYHELDNGGELEQPTYVGHWWCVRSQTDELLLRCSGRADACRQRIPSSASVLPPSKGHAATQISFRNDTSVPLAIYWEDPKGQRVKQATVQPSSVVAQNSYCGHIFHVVLDAGSCAESSKSFAASPLCTCTAALKPQTYVIHGDQNASSTPQLCQIKYTQHDFHGFTVMIEDGVLEKHPRLRGQLDGDLAEITRQVHSYPPCPSSPTIEHLISSALTCNCMTFNRMTTI